MRTCMKSIALRHSGTTCWRSGLTIRVIICALITTMVTAGSAFADTQNTTLTEADVLLEAHQYDQAAEKYNAVIDSAALESFDRSDAMAGLATSLMRLKKFDDAIAQFRQTLECESIRDATRYSTIVSLGYSLRRARQNEEAIQWFERIINDPNAPANSRAEAGLNCASAYHKIDQTDKAIECLKTVAAIEDAHPYTRTTAFVSLGRTHKRLKQYELARDAYTAALTLGDNGTRTAAARTELQEIDLLLQPDSAVFIKPWVVSVSETQATIHWVAKGEVEAAKLSAEPASVKVATKRSIEISPGFFLYESSLTNLTAGTQFSYNVTAGGEANSVSGAFYTPKAGNDKFTFCVLGDTQSRATVHKKIGALIGEEKPELVLHGGDCVERGVDWLQWQTQLFIPGRPYLKQAPVYPARGNHDGGGYFPRLFALTDHQYQSFDYGTMHVAVIDAFGPDSSGDALKAQAQWLDQDLGSSNADWKVVILHDPMVNDDMRNAWWGLDLFMPLIEKHGVAVVFSGHHHRYRRFMPLHPPGKPDASATWHITTGGSGGTLSGYNPSPLTVATQLVHHFLRVDVDGNDMNIKAITIDGETLDTIAIKRLPDGKITSESETAVDRDIAHKIVTLYTHLSPFKQPGKLLADYQDDHVVIDFQTLAQGPLDTSNYPADLKLHITAAEDCHWQVKPTTVTLRDVAEIRFKATAPETGGGRLKIIIQPMLGDTKLVPQTFETELTTATVAAAVITQH